MSAWPCSSTNAGASRSSRSRRRWARPFSEENNAEAGEHWTPRDAVKLMAKRIFLPIADQITDATYLHTTGPAARVGGSPSPRRCSSRLPRRAANRWPGTSTARRSTGREINPETYAIAKADPLLMGEGEVAELGKMQPGTRPGSRIAEVHNGSSLFTCDAGQGEGNIRRWIIEHDRCPMRHAGAHA